jgi:hypothetical protein
LKNEVEVDRYLFCLSGFGGVNPMEADWRQRERPTLFRFSVMATHRRKELAVAALFTFK